MDLKAEVKRIAQEAYAFNDQIIEDYANYSSKYVTEVLCQYIERIEDLVSDHQKENQS